MTGYDYLIVGGGSAGCVLADGLSESGKHTVLLIESGRKDTDPFIHIPAGLFKVAQKGRDVCVYDSEPEPHMNNRINSVLQGHVIGGGSSVNAMAYIRGQRQDYDDWRNLGCTGWGYDDVLPVFKSLENNQRLADEFHGTDGPLRVSDRGFGHPLSCAFIQAAQQSGISHQDDFNGAVQDGVGYYQTTTSKNRRASSAVSFLRRAEGRKNLTIMTQIRVGSVAIENNVARAVLLEDGRRIEARKEIILTAGAIATPKILQLSGVGPAEHLKSHGIDVVADVPGVGENYHDHLEATVQLETHDPISLFRQDKGIAAAKHMLQYMLYRTGLLASTVVESGGFVDTTNQGRPDIQFHVLPVLTPAHDRPPIEAHGISINPCYLRPKSRGHVRLRSSDPKDAALFTANAFSDPQDLDTLVRGVSLSIKIAEQPALQKLTKQRLLPEPGIEKDATELRDFVLNNAKTVYHPAGTAKLGSDDDKMAALDLKLNVRGVRNLRVADASVMPILVSGNTNAPTMMIAKRAVEFILQSAVSCGMI